MKALIRKGYITLLFSIVILGAMAQSVEYYYDASGNRVTRTIVALKSAQVADSVVTDSTNTQNQGLPKKNGSEGNFGSTPELYPNPTKGQLLLRLPEYQAGTGDELWLFDAKGALVKHIKTLSPELKIDLNRQPQGSYYLKAVIAGKPYEWKIIKE
ncbi:MAG: hypothetical protein A2W95_01090 [Bacteroidetes bacterium GWA2_40_14]|jgi:hypothetical protein|nr:MAG: hypothetical protein A2W95_01090 [Bacteroidetes bacterium GWA2_40_14]